MEHFIDRCSDYCKSTFNETWNLFDGLHREEWMVVLAIVAVCGFLCLLGHGLRK